MIAALRGAPRSPAALAAWLRDLPLPEGALLQSAIGEGPARPYARRVLVAEPDLEVMLATWAPGATCAPHDHGGAEGAVRVLEGRCRHRVYAPRGEVLALVGESEHGPGEVLVADRDLVHAMTHAGGERLVTLHVYTPAPGAMVVYDVPRGRTLVVGPSCGAWVPDEGDVVRAIDGFVPPSEAQR